MNRAYRLIWNRGLARYVPAMEAARSCNRGRSLHSSGTDSFSAGIFAAAGLLTSLALARTAHALPILDLADGLAGWMTAGDVTVTDITSAFTIGGSPFSLTPASGYNMARIAANGGPTDVNATLGLSANALETFLNNSSGSITNFGLITTTYAFDPGTYSFSWAYAAEDYQPFNDGSVFSLVGGGAESLISLARNGSSDSDLSGPSPDTLILGSYGSTDWLTTSFTIASAGNYQIGFAAYNWDDTILSPNLFVSAIAGTFTGAPVPTSGGSPPPVFDESSGDVAGDVYSLSSPAYAEPTLTFEGGTLQYAAATITAKDMVLNALGGAIDTNDADVSVTGTISGVGPLVKLGAGTLALTGDNTFTGTTVVAAGTLALTGNGSIAASSNVNVIGILDIAGTSSGASITTLSGTGTAVLGAKTLIVTEGSTTFAGTLAGTGGVAIDGGSMSLSGVTTYTGATTISAGTLNLTGDGSVAESSAVVNNSVFNIAGTSAGASIRSLAGSGDVELGAKDLTVTAGSAEFSGVINGSGGMALSGGEMTLTGANTFTGATTITFGTLKLVDGGSLAASSRIVNGGVLDISGLSGAGYIKTLAGSGSVVLGGQTLTLTSATGSFSGEFAGSGGLTIAGGELTLDGASTYSGGTNIQNGAKLIVGSESALGTGGFTLVSGTLQTLTDLTLNGPVVLGDGAVSIDTAVDTITHFTAEVTTSSPGSACFEKKGAGTLILSAAATIASGTCVEQGSLYSNGQLNSVVTVAASGMLRGTGTITGPVTVHGVLAPGNSPGTLHATATIEMTAGSVYQEDINGTGTGAGPGNYSRLVISGTDNQFIAGGAALAPKLLDITGSDPYVPYVPQVGDVFRIVTAEGGIVGRFASVAQPVGLGEATRMDVFYGTGGSQSIDLFVVPTSYAAYVEVRGGNENARSVARALDHLVEMKEGDTASAFQEEFLYATNAQGIPLEAAATHLSGEIHAALLAAAPLIHRRLVVMIDRRPVPKADGDMAAVWVDVGTTKGGWKGDSASSGFDTKRSQVMVGWDLVNTGVARTGIGYLQDKMSASLKDESGSVTENVGFVYGQYGRGAVILEGLAGYGLSGWTTNRSDPLAPGSGLTVDLDGKTSLFSAALRMPLTPRGLSFEPYGRVTWEHFSRAAFSEGPSLASISAEHFSASGTHYAAGVLGGSVERNPLAVHFTYQFNLEVGRDDAELMNPLMDANLGDVGTVIRSPEVGRIYLAGSITGTARLTDRLHGYVGLSGEERSGKSTGLGANLGVRMSL